MRFADEKEPLPSLSEGNKGTYYPLQLVTSRAEVFAISVYVFHESSREAAERLAINKLT